MNQITRSKLWNIIERANLIDIYIYIMGTPDAHTSLTFLSGPSASRAFLHLGGRTFGTLRKGFALWVWLVFVFCVFCVRSKRTTEMLRLCSKQCKHFQACPKYFPDMPQTCPQLLYWCAFLMFLWQGVGSDLWPRIFPRVTSSVKWQYIVPVTLC